MIKYCIMCVCFIYNLQPFPTKSDIQETIPFKLKPPGLSKFE